MVGRGGFEPPTKERDPRAALDADIREADRRLVNLWDELEVGDRDQRADVRARIGALKARLTDLKAQRAQAETVASATVNEVALRRSVERAVTDWRGRLAEDVAAARKALRALLVGGKVTAKTVKRDGRRVYAVEGEDGGGRAALRI